MARVWRDYNLAYYKKTPTPAGALIAAQTKDQSAPPVAVEAQPVEQQPLEESAPPVHSTVDGAAVRAHQGITEYDWSR